MHALHMGDLTIAVEELATDRLALHWRGASNSQDPGAGLKAYFDVVFAEAATRQAVVELHFEELRFFNSATVSALLRLVTEAGRLSLPLTLHYNPVMRWQVHNFEGIAGLAASLPLVKVVAEKALPAH